MCSDDRIVHNGDAVEKDVDAKPIGCRAKPTYIGLILEHPNYRWFILSYIMTNCGEWLTYVACMSLLEQAQDGQGHVLITMLIVARLVSFTAFSFTGGTLADSRDRKQVMLVLDITGVFVALLYLQAQTSVAVLFVCAILQSALAGLYEPSRSAILPLLVEPDYLEKANEIGSVLWSLAASVGSTVGGFIVARYGVQACFVADSCFYLLSALVLATKLKGEYNVRVTNETADAPPPQLDGHEVADFLRRSDVLFYLFVKCSGALMYGAANVLNVTFAQVNGVMDSQRLGYMFTAIGIGCLIGPLAVPEGRRYLVYCVASILVMGLGYAAMGWFDNFWLKCVWTGVKAAGSAVLWVDATILIQTITPATLLGRISAMDFALSTLGEASSAVLAGALQDHGLSADHVAYMFGGLGIVLTVIWTTFFASRRSVETKSDGLDVELEPLHEADAVA